MWLELMAGESVILHEIESGRFTRDQVAVTYAILLRQSKLHDYDWRRINGAITTHWTPFALEYIKKRAWLLFAGHEKPEEAN